MKYIEKLEKEQYYQCWMKNPEFERSILLFDNGTNASFYIGNNGTNFGRNGGNFNLSSTTGEYYEATEEQIRWLNECIRINKFVPYESLPKQITYEIY